MGNIETMRRDWDERAKKWICELALRVASFPSIRKFYMLLRKQPLLGGLLRRGVQVLIPPESTVWIKVTQGPVRGLWFKVNPRFEIGYLLGKPEEPVLNALLGLLSQGGCFYDVGAHIGFYALLAARIGCRVYAFEPDPLNVERERTSKETS